MNNYWFYRSIRGAVFLLTFGVTALLAQWHVLRFGQSWPLYLIVGGVLRLLEATALAAPASVPGVGGFPGASGGGQYGGSYAGSYSGQPGGFAPGTSTGTAIVPVGPSSLPSAPAQPGTAFGAAPEEER